MGKEQCREGVDFKVLALITGIYGFVEKYLVKDIQEKGCFASGIGMESRVHE